MSGSRVTVRKSAGELTIEGPGGVERFSVSIGSNPDLADKLEVGDCRTPEGEFPIVSIEDSSEWEHEGRRSYGRYFLRLLCPPWEGIGIHGTDEPERLGTPASRGCIRMSDEGLARLVELVEIGTIVRIVP
ncbi:MAG: L,D-transpeptidase family protein [Candidatus Eisenbacteria bacterium]|nr:L,D-transpeptidase family protein [Candidatus Eisenbacteria bacterium]